jgi:hypothetical protein
MIIFIYTYYNMFITPVILEPTTASIAVYLLSKTLNIKIKLVKKEPLHYKKKLCKWVYKNKHEMVDIGVEEIGDVLFDLVNTIHIIPHPSIYLLCYSLILIIIIIL